VLLETLGSDDEDLRADAAVGLGLIGAPAACPAAGALGQALDDPNCMVRQAAAEALGEMAPAVPDLLPVMQKALHNDGPGTREVAAKVLGKIGGDAVIEDLGTALNDSCVLVVKEAAAALARRGKPGIGHLIAGMTNADGAARCFVVKALGSTGDSAAVDPLTQALGDKDCTVRLYAARALGGLQDRRAVEPLKALLADPDSAVRSAAAEALKKIRGEEAAK
jgi:HEAT repeat protein